MIYTYIYFPQEGVGHRDEIYISGVDLELI